MRVVGLMSGTSGDGVDAALVDITGRGRALKARTLSAHTLAYPRSLRQAIDRLGQRLSVLLSECDRATRFRILIAAAEHQEHRRRAGVGLF